MKRTILCSIIVTSLLGCNDSGDQIGLTDNVIDDYDKGLSAIQTLNVGSKSDRDDPILKSFYSKVISQAIEYNNSIHFDKENEFWSDLPLMGENMHSTQFALERLTLMSQAYIIPGQLYLNEELLNNINKALNVFVDKYYDGKHEITDWYFFQIGIPRELTTLVANLNQYLDYDLKKRVYDSIAVYQPSLEALWTGRTDSGFEDKQTSANRIDIAWGLLARGLMLKNDADIELAKKSFSTSPTDAYKKEKNALPYTAGAFELSTIDGFREDGSYVFHGSLPYSNGYGLDLLNRAAEILYIINGTDFDFTQSEKDKILDDAFKRIDEAYLPWLKDGLGLDPTAGRAVDRGFEQNFGKGQWAIQGLIKYYVLANYGSDPVVNSERKAKLGTFIKSFLNDEEGFYSKYGSDSKLYQKHKFENYLTQALTIKMGDEIKSSPYVYKKEPLLGTYVFGEMDRAVHRRDDFTFAVSSHSFRTGNFEIVGYEGSSMCYSADGMTYIYDSDISQYSDYWVVFDKSRPAGVTNDGKLPDNPFDCTWSSTSTYQRKSRLTWSGGVADTEENFGVFGMDYKDWQWSGSNLIYGFLNLRNQDPNVEAKKSWFMFDDYILALGSDISCNKDCSSIETTIDNRKASINNDVYVDGNKWQGADTISSVNYLHISGNTGNGLGVVFPETENLKINRSHREGDWLYTSARAGKLMDSTYVESDFIRVSIPHGDNGNDDYSYILMPEKDNGYLEHNYLDVASKFSILKKDSDLHLIEYIPKSTYAMNIFSKPSNSFTKLSSSRVLEEFKNHNNLNTPLTGTIASELLTAAETETFYGVDNGIKSTGSASVMYRLLNNELTLWVSQPTRDVMSVVLDFSGTGMKATSVISGKDNIVLNSDGSKAVVKFDLAYIGTAMVITDPKWLGKGLTYKFKIDME